MRDSTCYVIAGTRTFRLGSRKILKTYGGNLQNKEKSSRAIYVPDLGYKFGQRDQSGAEALIVAYLCEAGRFRQLFENNVKPHVFVALHLFQDVWKEKIRTERIAGDLAGPELIDELVNTDIPLLKANPFWRDIDLLIKDSDNWSLQERYYYLAKQTCHSSNYGINPPTFRMNILEKSGGKIVISKYDSERFIETYHSLFPEIRKWHRQLQNIAEQTRVLYNLHGHPYQLTAYELLESKWKELYAWVPQSTVGEITRIAFTRMQEYIESAQRDWDMMQDNHDSFLTQFPDSPIEEKDWLSKSAECLEQEFVSPVDGVKFRMKSEAATGYNWAPYHKDKNPNGLMEVK